ncbi:hypothetical protein PMIN02_004872 [Paraphaeosphaeria minitans]
MRVSHLLSYPILASAVNILLSNDDGWAELNIRTFYNALTSSGNSVVISAPADNKSGTGSSDSTPQIVDSPGCQFSSCPGRSPANGYNVSNTRFNYVNSYPVTSVKYGIATLAPEFFNGKPALVVAGPNVGSNLGSTTLISGTVGAASYAASTGGVPAIAFSGSSGSQIAWTTSPVPVYSSVYATLATTLTNALLDTSTPYLPASVYLNVNFPSASASASASCTSATKFKFVLSRVNAASGSTAADVSTCGSTRLPTESNVVGTSGCYVSVSVGNAATKGDSTAANQAVVLGKLKGLLSCLP